VVVPEHLGEPARRLKALMNNGHPCSIKPSSRRSSPPARSPTTGAYSQQYMLRRDRLFPSSTASRPSAPRRIDGGMHLTCHLPDHVADAMLCSN